MPQITQRLGEDRERFSQTINPQLSHRALKKKCPQTGPPPRLRVGGNGEGLHWAVPCPARRLTPTPPPPPPRLGAQAQLGSEHAQCAPRRSHGACWAPQLQVFWATGGWCGAGRGAGPVPGSPRLCGSSPGPLSSGARSCGAALGLGSK